MSIDSKSTIVPKHTLHSGILVFVFPRQNYLPFISRLSKHRIKLSKYKVLKAFFDTEKNLSR